VFVKRREGVEEKEDEWKKKKGKKHGFSFLFFFSIQTT